MTCRTTRRGGVEAARTSTQFATILIDTLCISLLHLLRILKQIRGGVDGDEREDIHRQPNDIYVDLGTLLSRNEEVTLSHDVDIVRVVAQRRVRRLILDFILHCLNASSQRQPEDIAQSTACTSRRFLRMLRREAVIMRHWHHYQDCLTLWSISSKHRRCITRSSAY